MAKKERRKHKRASLELPLDVMDTAPHGKRIKAKTVNLSAGGFYCQVPFHVPVLTRLRVSMTIPVKDDQGRDADHAITCEGTVVRTVPEKPDPDFKTYEIGCFFTDIDDFDRLVIEEYLAERVLSGA
jgi:c-di-GMP-binding flagellar brake protein YcgR